VAIGRFFRVLATGAATLFAAPALADNAPAASEKPIVQADADAVVLAVQLDGGEVGGRVGVTIYDSAGAFLEKPAAKHEAHLNKDGVALVRLADLKPGDYAFVAYFDENGDGKLNRSAIGKPKEPYIFSKNVKPKLRKPTFDETKVSVAPGEVLVLTLKS
jgi:uncharacterized protein (DUF2141 family)